MMQLYISLIGIYNGEGWACNGILNTKTFGNPLNQSSFSSTQIAFQAHSCARSHEACQLYA